MDLNRKCFGGFEQDHLRCWFLKNCSKDVHPFNWQAKAWPDALVQRIIQECPLTTKWWKAVKTQDEHAALIAVARRIIDPFEHVMHCISAAGAVSFFTQISLQSLDDTACWPSEFRRVLFESGFEVLLMYVHKERKKARTLFVLRSRNPEVLIDTRTIALSLSKVFNSRYASPERKFTPVLYLTDTSMWAIAAAHIAFWRYPTARFHCMFDPSKKEDFMQLPGVTLIEMRLLLDWLMVMPFARMIRQSLVLPGEPPKVREALVAEMEQNLGKWGMPVDTKVRDHLVWIPKSSKMFVAASCMAQVKDGAVLRVLLCNLEGMLGSLFPSTLVHHVERTDPTTHSLVLHLFLRFAYPVNLCGPQSLYQKVQEVFNETMCATLLTLIPVDGFGESTKNPLAFAILATHFPHPSPEREAFWGAYGYTSPRPGPTDLERSVETMREWFFAEPELVEPRFRELYLSFPQWLDWDLNEDALSMRGLTSAERYEKTVYVNSVLSRLGSVSSAMMVCGEKMEQASRDFICVTRDGQYARLKYFSAELGDAAACCRGIMPTLEAFQAPPATAFQSPSAVEPKRESTPAIGQKRDALGRPKKRVASTPMQLTAEDNQLKRLYSCLFEAHALLDGLLQGARDGPDPYWMSIDWDQMLEEVRQMHAKLATAQGLAYELHRSHEETLAPGLC